MTAKIAIVGAGPSGCYLAQALLKAQSDLQIDILDVLPVPFGLVRYGVAPDHQGTKAVARQFARIFERQGARFIGNVHVGKDVTLQALREAYDIVVLAAGLSQDRRLGIPGDDLPNVHGAARLIRALQEHPDADPLPDLGPHPVIVGNGNVAIDLLRLLCKTPDEFHGSDLGQGPGDWLAANKPESIIVVGRSPASRARFDPVMIRELKRLGNVAIDVIDADASDDHEGRKRLEALAEIDGHRSGSTRLVFRFGLTPLAVEGEARAVGLRVAGNEGEETIPASSVLTAIGFTDGGNLDRDALVGEGQPDEGGKLADRLFAVGWFRAGSRGAIPDSRADAQLVATRILEEISVDAARPGCDILAGLSGTVTYAGWQKIDAAEQGAAPPTRCRCKLPTRNELLKAAGQEVN